jgi:hypothetical protein
MQHTHSTQTHSTQAHSTQTHSTQAHSTQAHSAPASPATAPSPSAHIDLYCYETMPAPSELGKLAKLAMPGLPALPTMPCPSLCSHGLCWCLEPCAPDSVCISLHPLSRKRQRSPSPPDYRPGDDYWVQSIKLFHPTDFSYTTVEMDSNRPLRAIFHELCADQGVERKHVAFVWIRKRASGRVQQVKLSDESVPWTLGMREGVVETIECEFA